MFDINLCFFFQTFEKVHQNRVLLSGEVHQRGIPVHHGRLLQLRKGIKCKLFLGHSRYLKVLCDFAQVHVCLLVCEARLQSSLLYAYKAVSDYYMDKNC